MTNRRGPCTRHDRRRITRHRRTLRSDSASYARALDRAHNLSRLRDEIGIASDHFKARNERNANTEVLDFMHGWMNSRHEGCVNTMLTDTRLQYCTGGAPLQGSVRRNGGCKTKSTAFRGAFGLDIVRV